MSQPLANIVLKINQFGSTVALKHVTPAEVMFLVADHNGNAGGDPVVKLEELEERAEKEPLKDAKVKLTELETKRSELDAIELTPELRERRETHLNQQIQQQQDRINGLLAIIGRRNLSPSEERVRLANKYGAVRIKKFYAGSIPNLPATFAEARSAGVEASAPSERLLTVGDQA